MMTLEEFKKTSSKKETHTPSKIIARIMERVYNMRMEEFHSDENDSYKKQWLKNLSYWKFPGAETQFSEWVGLTYRCMNGDKNFLESPSLYEKILMDRLINIANGYSGGNSIRLEDIASVSEIDEMDNQTVMRLFYNIKTRDYYRFNDSILKCKVEHNRITRKIETLGEALEAIRADHASGIDDMNTRSFMLNLLVCPFISCFESEKNADVRALLLG